MRELYFEIGKLIGLDWIRRGIKKNRRLGEDSRGIVDLNSARDSFKECRVLGSLRRRITV